MDFSVEKRADACAMQSGTRFAPAG